MDEPLYVHCHCNLSQTFCLSFALSTVSTVPAPRQSSCIFASSTMSNTVDRFLESLKLTDVSTNAGFHARRCSYRATSHYYLHLHSIICCYMSAEVPTTSGLQPSSLLSSHPFALLPDQALTMSSEPNVSFSHPYAMQHTVPIIGRNNSKLFSTYNTENRRNNFFNRH